jgi:hypothetical protein
MNNSNELPEIKPLRNEGKREAIKMEDCQCDLCQHWIPLVKHIQHQLDDEGKKLFEELLNDWEAACFERDVAEAKLAGAWPGWEGLEIAIPRKEGD